MERTLGALDVELLIEELLGTDLETWSAVKLAEHMAGRRPTAEERFEVAWRLEEARQFWTERHYGPAVVVAQSVAEAYFEESMTALFHSHRLEYLEIPVRELVMHGEFALSRKQHQQLWNALARDDLGSNRFWHTYQTGRQLRNRWVHAGTSASGRRGGRTSTPGVEDVTDQEAEAFILAVVELIRHLEQKLASVGLKRPTERSPTKGFVHKDGIAEATVLVDGITAVRVTMEPRFD